MIINLSRRIINLSKPFFRNSFTTISAKPELFINKFYSQILTSLEIQQDNPYDVLKKMVFTLDHMFKQFNRKIVNKNSVNKQQQIQQVENSEVQRIKAYEQFFQQTNKEILQALSIRNTSTQQKSQFMIYYLNIVKNWVINNVENQYAPEFNKIIEWFASHEIWKETHKAIQQKIQKQQLNILQRQSIVAYISFCDKALAQKALKQINFRKINKIFLKILIRDAIMYNYALTHEQISKLYENQNLVLFESVDECYQKLKFVKHYSYLAHHNSQFMNFSEVSRKYATTDFNKISSQQFMKMIEIVQYEANVNNTDYIRKLIGLTISYNLKLLIDRKFIHNQLNAAWLLQIYVNISKIVHVGSFLFIKLLPFLQILEFSQKNFELIKEFYQHLIYSFTPVCKVDRTDNMNKSIINESFEILSQTNKKILNCKITKYQELILSMGNLNYFYPSESHLKEFAQQYSKLLSSIIRSSEDLLKNNQRFVKITSFICQNNQYLQIQNDCLDLLKKQLTLSNLSKLSQTQQCKVLHYILQIEPKSPIAGSEQLYTSLIDKFIIQPMNRQLDKQILINTQKYYYNYLCFSLQNFCKKYPQSSKAAEYKQKLIKFVNKKLLYTIKSIKRQDHPFLFDTLKFIQFEKLTHDILTTYIESFCSFIAYSCENQKYYLVPEPRKNFYHDVVDYSLTHQVTNVLIKIHKKNKIQMLENLAQAISKDIPKEQLSRYKCQLIRIFRHPNNLNQTFVSSLSGIQFSESQLKEIQPQILQNFEYLNHKIANYLKNTGFEVSGTQIKLSSNIAKQLRYLQDSQIKTIFKNKEIYQFLLKSPHFDPQTIDKIPEPTNLAKQYESIQYMYHCLRLYSIIKNYQTKVSGKINTQYAGSSNLQIFDTFLNRKTELSLLTPYLTNISSKFNNQADISMADFYLSDEKSIARTKKPQIWKNYNHPAILEVTDSIFEEETIYCVYENIVKAFYKKSLNLRDIFQQYSFHSSIALQVLKLNYQYQITGSCLEILKENDEQSKVVLICYNPDNYKVHYLCGYLLYMKGFKVGLINRNAKDFQINNFLKNSFSAAPDKN